MLLLSLAAAVQPLGGAIMEQWERLLDELREEFILREEELRLLHQIDLRLLESQRPLQGTFEFIVRRTQEIMKSDLTAILLKRGGRLETAYSLNKSVLGQHLAISSSLTGESLTREKTLNVPDVTRQPYFGKYVPIDGYDGPPLRSLLATPIKVHQTLVGVLSTESTRVRAFKRVHENIIGAIASQVAIALQRAQLFDQHRLFSEVDSLILTPGESQHVISLALQKVMDELQVLEHVKLSGAQILFRKGDKDLEVVHSTDPAHVGLVLSADSSICGRALRTNRTVTISDVESEPDYRSMLGPSIRSEIAIPIMFGEATFIIGVLNVESEEQDAFEGFSQVLLESFADKVRTLLAFVKLRADVTEAMEMRAASDVLIAIGDQASNMIHRMNNTVGAMRLRILELQDHENDGDFGDHLFLRESLAALHNLADQTLMMPDEVSRLLNRQGVTVNVNEVVQAVLGKTDVPADVSIELDLDPKIPPLSLYSFDIVVENLLQNAFDAMPDGGVLTVSTLYVFPERLANGYVELTVCDSGTGIADEILPRIFDLNFTTKHAKGKGHGGLGLWWIRNFVLRARGDISVANQPGGGAAFVVKIPIEHSPSDDGPKSLLSEES